VNAPSSAAWLDALEAELASLATTTLGFSGVAALARVATPPRMEGAYLGLVSAEGAYQIGLASEPAGCEAMARGLLCMEPGAEALPPADVADAMCEIVNILAGGVKRRIREASGLQLGLGLPTFFHGAVQPTERLAVAVAEVRVGEIPAALLVLHPRSSSEER
jgi:Chemotaxis phosphatase CheX